ncbi:MAG: cytochrome P450 [Pseudomonadota bacterium]
MVKLTDLPAGFHDDPYPLYAQLRANGVTPQPDGSVIVARYADLDRIYRDTGTFISDKKAVFGPKYGEGTPLYRHHTTSLVFNDPPLHTRVRKIMVGAMTPRALGSMEPGLIALVDRLTWQMQSQDEVDLIHSFAGAIPVEVIGNLFNIPRGERGPLQAWSLAILGALEPQLTPDQEARGHKAVTDFVAYLEGLVADRAKHPGDPETDVLTRLMQSEDGQLSLEELYQNCIFILNAGHETTTNLIGSALWLLDQDRDAKAQLIATPDLLPTAVDEFLRMESPNQFGNRLTTTDFILHGHTVPAGTDIHLCIGAANRDPDQFAEPGKLRLDRRPNKHLAFAGGAHTCVGLTLARMEGRIAVGKFLEAFPRYEITDATRAGRVRFRGFSKLMAKLNPA